RQLSDAHSSSWNVSQPPNGIAAAFGLFIGGVLRQDPDRRGRLSTARTDRRDFLFRVRPRSRHFAHTTDNRFHSGHDGRPESSPDVARDSVYSGFSTHTAALSKQARDRFGRGAARSNLVEQLPGGTSRCRGSDPVAGATKKAGTPCVPAAGLVRAIARE